MTKTEVLKELKALGSESARKTYRRHGATGEIYGVRYADLGKLTKKIKVDQDLASELWATGIHDAQVLATMIAEPTKMTAAKINAWVKGVGHRGEAAAVSNVAAECKSAQKRAEIFSSVALNFARVQVAVGAK